jgi:hypothetical protein
MEEEEEEVNIALNFPKISDNQNFYFLVVASCYCG